MVLESAGIIDNVHIGPPVERVELQRLRVAIEGRVVSGRHHRIGRAIRVWREIHSESRARAGTGRVVGAAREGKVGGVVGIDIGTVAGRLVVARQGTVAVVRAGNGNVSADVVLRARVTEDGAVAVIGTLDGRLAADIVVVGTVDDAIFVVVALQNVAVKFFVKCAVEGTATLRGCVVTGNHHDRKKKVHHRKLRHGRYESLLLIHKRKTLFGSLSKY